MPAYFLLGIGGMGMSALACWLQEANYPVAGTDREPHRGRALYLAQRGISISLQGSSALKDYLETHQEVEIIASPAVENTVSEMQLAKKHGLKITDRVDFLLQLFHQSTTRIAIAGTAGKTTTAALLIHILTDAQQNPSWLMGGIMPTVGNGHFGTDDVMIIELDESDGRAHRYRPTILAITNLHSEHRPMEQLLEDFSGLLTNLTEDGHLLTCGKVLPESLSTKANTTNCQNWLTIKKTDPQGQTIVFNNQDFLFPMVGVHNLRNMELAIHISQLLGVSQEQALHSLQSFSGVENRMKLWQNQNGLTLYSDFAHSPDEITAAYKSLAAIHDSVILVYQPHGYTPTRLQWDNLLATFTMMRESDTLILTDIYYGGGTVKRSFSGEDFATAVSQQHKKTIFVANLANLPKVLSDAITGKSAICLAGARTIHDWTMAVQSELFSTN